MNHSEVPTATRRVPILAAVVVSIAAIGVLAWTIGIPHGDHETLSAATVTGGAVPGGVSIFDDKHPSVVNLDPELLGALRRAATDAADDGVAFVVNSGWRSPEYQRQLLRDAVSKYGSE
ncbi:hypothetical protein ACFWF7_02960 [Nocardia sp. NPDC060256]|uniref:hypothetical protein n=1 Tax=unclassified Nocardia TaxID=2637762 RepID=UPI00365A5740